MSKMVKIYESGEFRKVEEGKINNWFNGDINWNTVDYVELMGDRAFVKYKDGNELIYKEQNNGLYAFPIRIK
ncbi:hypothetical protein DP124_12125 [Clostridium tetani]|uniref:Uncharacterized protein n=2 Tax=Clostridium tetani TaxID=1513 RepID=A0ABC8EFW9_CLOTA|nr:hypothetical protein [Clostridium tetani]RXI50210.1 hypothetical protein DP124_12125 [Clostridium tetani]RXI58946.1 hypothetical protein DP131_00300 [Clostridium tetani]BDR82573.1 hypothetical protein K234311028_p20560 [Clostridium tetani]